MKNAHLAPIVLAAAPMLLLAGCSDAQWGEYAGGGRGMAQASAASGATVRTGDISGEMISATVQIIALHQATAAQREVALRRLQAWSGPGHRPRTGTRYIAVRTSASHSASPASAASVILFDTQAQQIVGNNVYDIATPPAVGALARFETYSAQYVGPAAP